MPRAAKDPPQSARSSPTVFETRIRVVSDDIDGLGHANNVVYLRWVQVAASKHWRSAATPQQLSDYAWVAIRHEIDYLHPALEGDELILRTYVGDVSGVRFERFVEIHRAADLKRLARARSVWVAVDPATKRPKRIDPAVNRQFFAE